MPSKEEQRRRLTALLQDTGGWGVLLYMEPRYGSDVSFLVPVVPSLAGYEIVAASPDPDAYDIWKTANPNDEYSYDLVHTNWRRNQVARWLAEHTPADEETLKEHIAEWVEATFARYGIPRVG